MLGCHFSSLSASGCGSLCGICVICGFTFALCHLHLKLCSNTESRSFLIENRRKADPSLRPAHHTVRGFARDDKIEGFFSNLLD